MEQAVWRAVIKVSVGVRPEDALCDLYIFWQSQKGSINTTDAEWFQALTGEFRTPLGVLYSTSHIKNFSARGMHNGRYDSPSFRLQYERIRCNRRG